jgi:uncharacterized protein VirK/YbjX
MQQQVHRRAGAIELFRQQSSATPTTHWHLILPRTHDLHLTAMPPPAVRRAGRMAMHFLRCLPHLDTFRDWLGNPANPALREEIAARPYLLTCVVHPYLNSEWPAQRKLAVIAAHYAMLGGQRAVLRGTAPQLLADAGDGLRIELDLPGKFEHEGEATLHLRRGEQDLYALAFTLGDIAGQRVAYVGALQGLRSPDALET